MKLKQHFLGAHTFVKKLVLLIISEVPSNPACVADVSKRLIRAAPLVTVKSFKNFRVNVACSSHT
jgi:hypothetical protein